ncbi:MAG: twin-arginine translocation signal domain-containing protein, partial [Candidatus Hydrogenedentes bacterium]|nr:twin-arginine translocation signal domain-containing protein [Candidatus Hydrogenedentota bacterium]
MSETPVNFTENDAGKTPAETRRNFLKVGAGVAAAAAGIAAATLPLHSMQSGLTLDAFLQQHYKRLTPEMLEEILRRIEAEIARDYGAKVTVQDIPPLDGVQFGYALNLSRCNGNRRCVEACVKE